MQKINIFLIIACLILSACTKTAIVVDPTNRLQLRDLYYDVKISDPSTDFTQIRHKALEETAMTLGAQGGLAWASERINARLQKDRWYLESVYNFNGMMLTHGVIPPVLAEGNFSLNLDDPNTIRVADKTYKIIQQARFATTPPNWRDYLWLTFTKPEVPVKFLLPKTPAERVVWQHALDVGWEKGVQQASSIFQLNLARLKRDFQGMILYRKLLAQKMINAPYVSRTELGVTGNGEDMRINDQVLRITVHPTLQTESSNWRAIVVKHDD